MAAASLDMAINETHLSQMLSLVVVDEIHNLIMIFMTCLTRVTVHEELDRGLGLKFRFSFCHFLLNFQSRISALSPTINVLWVV